jgi:hypothetical protein
MRQPGNNARSAGISRTYCGVLSPLRTLAERAAYAAYIRPTISAYERQSAKSDGVRSRRHARTQRSARIRRANVRAVRSLKGSR